MYRPGPRNLITDVAGLLVGHGTDEGVQSGVTVLTSHSDWAASVDVRGGGPGTRETDALAPENLIGRAHAVVLAGGSVFGLAAADGVAAALSAAGTGLKLRPGSPSIPLVPAAVLHDLGNGGNKRWGTDPPYRNLGLTALGKAAADFTLGSVGAGRGAMAGLAKGGIGSASIDIGYGDATGAGTGAGAGADTGIIVGALVAVNSIGSVFMPDGKTYWAWPFELDDEFGGAPPPLHSGFNGDPAPDDSRLLSLGRLAAGANTTLGVIACNADLTSVECKRVAMMAQDGIARAVRPAHTPFDGDTIFALASGAIALDADGRRPVQIARIGAAAADCLARAIARAVYFAR